MGFCGLVDALLSGFMTPLPPELSEFGKDPVLCRWLNLLRKAVEARTPQSTTNATLERGPHGYSFRPTATGNNTPATDDLTWL